MAPVTPVAAPKDLADIIVLVAENIDAEGRAFERRLKHAKAALDVAHIEHYSQTRKLCLDAIDALDKMHGVADQVRLGHLRTAAADSSQPARALAAQRVMAACDAWKQAKPA